MPSSYTGNPAATEAPSPPPGANVAPIVSLPIDPDAFNAASHYQVYKVLADFIAWLTLHGAWDDLANTFSATNIFSGSNTFSALPVILDGEPAAQADTSTAPTNGTHYREIFRFPVKDGGGTARMVCRIYTCGRWQWALAINCAWDEGAAQWTRVVTGNTSVLFRVGLTAFNSGGFSMDVQSNGDPDTWTDAAWVRPNTFKMAHNTGVISMLLGTTPNAITLDDQGLSGSAAIETSAGGHLIAAAAGDDVFGWGMFRRRLPAGASSATYVVGQTAQDVNCGVSQGQIYAFIFGDANGVLVRTDASAPGGYPAACYFLTRFVVS